MRKLIIWAASFIAASLGISCLAVGAPVNSGKAFHGSSYDATEGCNTVSDEIYGCFSARTEFDPSSGMRNGIAEVWGGDGTNFFYVYCNGPGWPISISVNPGNGKSTTYAVLDPNNPVCSSYGVSQPITLDVSGEFDGTFSDVYTQSGTRLIEGVTYRYNLKGGTFRSNFIGAAAPAYSVYEGYATSVREVERWQVK
jgi:hypothetical protein